MGYKPEGHQDAIANLTFKDSKTATEFYKKSLGACNIQVMESDTGWVMHGEMKVGDSVIFYNDEADFIPRKAPASL